MLAALAFAFASFASPEPPPNILFAIADDWGWPHAGCYGDTVVRTPTCDRLAAEGVRFEAAFVSSPSCTPSRNAILTGQAFFRLGLGANLWSTLDPEHATFPDLLAAAGYHVGHWRKAWGPGRFDAAGRTTDPAGPAYPSFDAFLDARADNQPFCFWLGASDPHRPYDADGGARADLDPTAVAVPPPLPDTDEVRTDITNYYAEVERFDRDVGAALRRLEEMGELERTLVVMTGDHGWPFPRGKCNVYDLGVRVPLLVRFGGQLEGGTSVDDPVSLADLAPTFLESAGVEVPAAMTGESLWPLLRGGPERPRREHVIFGRERHTIAQQGDTRSYPVRAIRTRTHLYIENLRPEDWPAGYEAKGPRPFRDCDNGPTKSVIIDNRADWPEAFRLCFAKRPGVELYDLVRDPWQIENLAELPEHAAIRRTLAEKLTAERERLGDPRRGSEVVEAFDEGPYQGR
ncbi:MAG: sulfatase [Planctomycetota bacterium]